MKKGKIIERRVGWTTPLEQCSADVWCTKEMHDLCEREKVRSLSPMCPGCRKFEMTIREV